MLRYTLYFTLLLRLQVALCLRNGSVAAVVPPLSAWRAARGPVVSNDVYAGEVYDARLEQPGWVHPGFVPSAPFATAWAPAADGAAAAAKLLGELSLHRFTPIRRVASSAPVKMWTVPTAADGRVLRRPRI